MFWAIAPDLLQSAMGEQLCSWCQKHAAETIHITADQEAESKVRPKGW